jgi:hypothetical protein
VRDVRVIVDDVGLRVRRSRGRAAATINHRFCTRTGRSTSAYSHCGPHPRMDAALIVLDSSLGCCHGKCGARRNEAARTQCQALRSGRRVAGEIVQQWYDAASELLDFRERVNLTAAIHRRQCGTLQHGERGWREVPCAGLLVLLELGDELLKCHASVAQAGGGILQRSVERGGVARIVHRHEMIRFAGPGVRTGSAARRCGGCGTGRVAASDQEGGCRHSENASSARVHGPSPVGIR